MAVITPGAFTYAEWGLRHDPDGKISMLVNLLSQQNGILDDCLTVECQSGNAFEYTQVVKLPTPTRRQYNQGVPRTLAGVAKQTTVCSEYADWVVFDNSLAKLGGNLSELRAQEQMLHWEGLSQTIASDLFYANRNTDPTAFMGMSNIYNTVSTATSQIANNVIDMGGTGSTNSSVWLVGWGPKAIHTIFPKGLAAGFVSQDMGLLPALDTQSPAQEFLAWRDWLQWNIGVAIHDWRMAVRACNIDVSLLNGANAANLINMLVQMVHKPPIMPVGVAPIQDSDAPDKLVMARWAIYCNRTIMTYLDQQAMNKTNVLLRMEDWQGQSVTTFRGIPIRCVDALLTTESRVV